MLNERLLCPSMNCANYDCLKEETIALDLAGVDIFHMDIMDGYYMPTMAMGMGDFKCVRRNTKKPLDVHLYAINPFPLVDVFIGEGADIIYVLPDAPVVTSNSLDRINLLGKSPGLGINYGTSIESIGDLLYMVDYVMVNTSPNIGPRTFAPQAWEKVKKLLELRTLTPFKILLDGAIGLDIVKRASAMGVDGYVLGTVGLFKPDDKRSYPEYIDEFRRA